LIDGHVHVTAAAARPTSRRVCRGPTHPFSLAGVTTVVGLLGTDDVARGPRDLLATTYALPEEGLNA
jgi:beta-aspartyl-dipeptidase (metallo-type)